MRHPCWDCFGGENPASHTCSLRVADPTHKHCLASASASLVSLETGVEFLPLAQNPPFTIQGPVRSFDFTQLFPCRITQKGCGGRLVWGQQKG